MAGQHTPRPRRRESAFQATVNLPRTAFPMRAHLPIREVEILQFWEQLDLYGCVQEQNAGRTRFYLHDGPPFSTGSIHLGHALNAILKDVLVKFRSMQGYDAPFVPGWDTHGLTTEIQALKTMAMDRHTIKPLELRRRCTALAKKAVDVQREQFKRLGIRGDWERPYLTLQPGYEAAVLEAFAEMVARDRIYRGVQPVHWCTGCATALAESEIEYHDYASPAVYVAFPVVALPEGVLRNYDPARMAAMIRTTTPWLLPATVAIAGHPACTYVLATDADEQEEFTYLMARECLDDAAAAMQWGNPRVLGEVSGRALDGARLLHPFQPRDVRLLADAQVNLETGTGLAPLAPGYGKDDYFAGLRHGLPVMQPIGPDGRYGPEAGTLAGKTLLDGQETMLEQMDRDGTLLAYDTVTQSAPHCWRCRSPLMVRVTPQWMLRVGALQDTLPGMIDGIQWTPAWGRQRMQAMVAGRPDWCLSRQRAWGIPIPALYCTACGEPLLDAAIVRRVAAIVREQGSDAWYQRAVHELVPTATACAKCGEMGFRKETDIFDVWFDSGCSQFAVPAEHPDLHRPADLYLEGHDQFRGWLQASLLTAAAVGDTPPYRAAFAHGFVLDETADDAAAHPHKNLIDPEVVVREHGADLLRVWVVAADTRTDVVMSEAVFAQTVENYRRIRNTVRFLLGNLFDFDPALAVPVDELDRLDRWALHRLNVIIRQVTQAFDAMTFHHAMHVLHDFCTAELSAWYLDISKDRLYNMRPDAPERRSAQTAMYEIVETVARLLAPVMSFTAEEIWQALPEAERPLSVQLAAWPVPVAAWDDLQLAAQMADVLAIRDVVNAALTAARGHKQIGQPTSTKVTIYSAGKTLALLESWEDVLGTYLHVAAANTAPLDVAPADAYRGTWPHLAVSLEPAAGAACARCRQWRMLGTTPMHPSLCQRCAVIVEQLPTKRHSSVE